jgi:hypothetical protein
MAYATVKGQRYKVRVVPDLTDSFALEVYPEPPEGAEKRAELYKPWPVPLCLKIHADSKEHALEAGLAHMKRLGKIDDFHIEPSERPPPPAAKPTATKPASGEEEPA